MSAYPNGAPPGVAVLKFKRGDTVVLGCAAFDEFNAPADLTAVEIVSKATDAKETVVYDMEVEWVDRAQGTYNLWAPGNALAASWPIGNMSIDVEYRSQPVGARQMVRSTETFYLQISKDVS